MSYKKEVLMDVYHDIFKAAKIIGDIDHNFGYIDGEVSSYASIIRSCNQILLNVAEELFQIAEEDRKDKGE